MGASATARPLGKKAQVPILTLCAWHCPEGAWPSPAGGVQSILSQLLEKQHLSVELGRRQGLGRGGAEPYKFSEADAGPCRGFPCW